VVGGSRPPSGSPKSSCSTASHSSLAKNHDESYHACDKAREIYFHGLPKAHRRHAGTGDEIAMHMEGDRWVYRAPFSKVFVRLCRWFVESEKAAKGTN
jgi:hypothetical protein